MFREEVKLSKRDRLYGDVVIGTPLSWQITSAFLFCVTVGVLLFLLLGSYSRVERVNGQITLDTGVASVVPSRSGVITSVYVHDGERIKAGSPLVQISAEETIRPGRTGVQGALDALTDQDSRLASQERLILSGGNASRSRLRAEISGIQDALNSLTQRLTAQRQLIALAAQDYARAEEIAKRGFLSGNDLRIREETVLSRQQQLASLEQEYADSRAKLRETLFAASEVKNAAGASAAGVASDRASIIQHRYEVEASRGYALIAPVSGTVSALTAKLGQPAKTDAPLLTILPERSKLEATLFVPTRAAGFLALGQEVRLQVDAFPFSQFGTLSARISRISSSTVVHTAGSTEPQPVYLVTAQLERPSVLAFGKNFPLKSDMTLVGIIVLERRSLAQWLFEPMLALRRR